MPRFLDRLLGRTLDNASVNLPATDPTHPEYVPQPKAKDPAAVHPLVAAAAMRPKARAVGVGIVFDAAGRPKITKDWLTKLTPTDRAGVDAELARRGWKINDDFTVARTAGAPPEG